MALLPILIFSTDMKWNDDIASISGSAAREFGTPRFARQFVKSESYL